MDAPRAGESFDVLGIRGGAVASRAQRLASLTPNPAAGTKRGREDDVAGAEPVLEDIASGAPSSEPDAALRAQLAAVEAERQSLLDRSSMTYHERCAVFDSVRADALAQAIVQRQRALKTVEAMFEYHQATAEAACEVG